MRNKLLFIFSILLLTSSCSKDSGSPSLPPPPAGQLQLPHGDPIGNKVNKQIGTEGGTIQSTDGVVNITVPVGAVEGNVVFSIQEVENTLGTRAKSYRLNPENITFKKPLVLTYNYGSIDIGPSDPRHLFLACQDAEGYYYSATKTKLNAATNSLSVETTHFSDWTFYSLYEFEVTAGAFINGKIILGESESASFFIKHMVSKPVTSELDLLAPLVDPVITAAAWDLLPREGKLEVNQVQGRANYTAPNIIVSTKDIVVTATLNGNLGKDNFGNPVRQLQLVQPITLVTNDYFIISENGIENRATNMSGELIQLYGTQINASFADGSNLSCYVYQTSTGGFPYREHGTPGAATLEYVPADGKGYMVIYPNPCNPTGPGEVAYSTGTFTLTSLADVPGEYFAGNFTVTLYRFDWCESRETKQLSGRFRIRKKF